MRREPKELSPMQPALLVTYGNTTRKHRPLDADVVLIGRAPFCNFQLNAAEVAPIHCVIARTDAGWRIRDCTGRGASRLNGVAIHDEMLNNGDQIQIGAFSFEAQLPIVAGPRPVVEVVPDPALVREAEKLRHSRRGLGKRALALRKRLRQRAESHQARAVELDRWQAELTHQVEHLQHRVHEYDIRCVQLERSERDLTVEREKFDVDQERYQERLDELDLQQSQRQKVAEAALQARAEELEERQRQLAQEAALLAQRERELTERAQVVIPQPLPAALTPPAASEEVSLLSALRDLCADLNATRREELDRLQQAIAVAKHEKRELEHRLEARTVTLQQELETAREEAAQLQRDLESQATQFERMKEQRSTEDTDTDSYEAELNRFRQELEADREQVEEQIRQLRQRNADLEDTVRETELQLTRERAQLARDRMELMRLRDEIRLSQDRAPREPSLRERLLARTS